MNLGEKIKELRLKNNMTQDDLALKCYVTRNAVSKWENDKGYPNIESIKLLCKCFNITIDELLNDEKLAHANLESALNKQEFFWKEKANLNWHLSGDRNTN